MRLLTVALRHLVAELVATALLLATIVGSGIMGERLSGGNSGFALLANSLATGAALVALISAFGRISGAHMNPAVSLAEAALGRLRWRVALGYVLVQVVGAFAGVAAANLMFDLPPFSASTTDRSGGHLCLAEGVATFGLLAIVFGSSKCNPPAVPLAVGGYITAAYWFTSSTSFANPAVTLARAATDTFAGIRPHDVAGFVLAQAAGAVLATCLFRWLLTEPTAPCKP